MSDAEKIVVQKIAEAFKRLPDGRREYLLGFAEGVIHATAATEPQESANDTEQKA